MSMRLSISCIGLHFSRKPTFNVTNLLHSVGMSNRNHNGTSCTKRYPYFFQGYSLKPHYNDRSSQHAIKHIKWIFAYYHGWVELQPPPRWHEVAISERRSFKNLELATAQKDNYCSRPRALPESGLWPNVPSRTCKIQLQNQRGTSIARGESPQKRLRAT